MEDSEEHPWKAAKNITSTIGMFTDASFVHIAKTLPSIEVTDGRMAMLRFLQERNA